MYIRQGPSHSGATVAPTSKVQPEIQWHDTHNVFLENPLISLCKIGVCIWAGLRRDRKVGKHAYSTPGAHLCVRGVSAASQTACFLFFPTLRTCDLIAVTICRMQQTKACRHKRLSLVSSCSAPNGETGLWYPVWTLPCAMRLFVVFLSISIQLPMLWNWPRPLPLLFNSPYMVIFSPGLTFWHALSTEEVIRKRYCRISQWRKISVY